jgi:hypothetical protein
VDTELDTMMVGPAAAAHDRAWTAPREERSEPARRNVVAWLLDGPGWT